MKTKKPKQCNARTDRYCAWGEHRCGLAQGHKGSHRCRYRVSWSKGRQHKKPVPCPFEWDQRAAPIVHKTCATWGETNCHLSTLTARPTKCSERWAKVTCPKCLKDRPKRKRKKA